MRWGALGNYGGYNRGAEVVAVDLRLDALEMVREFGAVHTVHFPATDDVVDAIRRRREGRTFRLMPLEPRTFV